MLEVELYSTKYMAARLDLFTHGGWPGKLIFPSSKLHGMPLCPETAHGEIAEPAGFRHHLCSNFDKDAAAFE